MKESPQDWLAKNDLPAAAPPPEVCAATRLAVVAEDEAAAGAILHLLYGETRAHGRRIFLLDAKAPTARREAAREIARPAYVFEKGRWEETGGGEVGSGETEACIATGGSSGHPRFARHTPESLRVAVEGMRGFFGVERIDSLGPLPLHHVSGLMPLLRSFLTGGEYRAVSWKALESGAFPEVDAGRFFLSLVPTQLERLLETGGGAAFLRAMRAVLLGGAPAREALLEKARAEEVPLAPCYGMTETAAFCAAQPPEDFLAGGRGYVPLPGVEIGLGAGDERIHVRAPSLARGYVEGEDFGGLLATGDAGRFDAEGRLHLLGRLDRAVHTGGETVHPDAVEAALLGSGLVREVYVTGLPDAVWGERLVACVAAAEGVSSEGLEEWARTHLEAARRPREWRFVQAIPRTETGKVDRAALGL